MAATSLSASVAKNLLAAYPAAVSAAEARDARRKKGKLVSLDKWWRGEGRDAARERGHVTKEALIKLVTWKITRGKMRPLLGYARDMDARALEAASKHAFVEGTTFDDAIKPLIALRGIGPATASAILSWASDDWPFMSDEALLATGERTYTLKRLEALHASLGELAGKWGMSASDAEKVLYALANGDGDADGGAEGETEGAPAKKKTRR